MIDPYTGEQIDSEFANNGDYFDSFKIANDPYTDGGYGLPFGGIPPMGPGPMGPGMGSIYNMPGLNGPYGMYFRRGRRFKDIDFGNYYIGKPDGNFSFTRKVIKQRLRTKYPNLPNIAIGVMSMGEALIKHPFRKTLSNTTYNPGLVDLATKEYKKYY